MKKIFFLLLPLFCSCWSMANDTTAWIYTYGGSQEDYSRKIISTADSGYIVVGTTSSYGAGMTDVYVIKTDRDGVRQWSHAYGSMFIEWGYSIKQTADAGYIIAGYTNQQAASGYDIYLLRLDETGNVLWEKTIGGSDWDFGYDLEICADSGFLITGKSYSFTNGGSDLYLVKTDPDGNIVWEKHYGGGDDESGNAIIRNRNGYYGIAGETKSYGAGGDDAWVLQVNEGGDTIWTRTFGTPAFDATYGIDTSLDGQYHLIGTTYGSIQDTTSQMYFFKVDTTGASQWVYYYGGTLAEEGWVVKTLPNGQIMCGGMTYSYGNGNKAYHVLRNNINGIFLDGSSFGGVGDDEGFSLAVGQDKQIIFAGITNSDGCGLNDVYLIRVDTFLFTGSYDTLLFETCDSTIGISEWEQGDHPLFYVSPNPASGQSHVYFPGSEPGRTYQLVLSTATGKVIEQFTVRQFPFDLPFEKDPGPGIYLLSLYENGMLLSTLKLVRY